jgi:hypothetical protein
MAKNEKGLTTIDPQGMTGFGAASSDEGALTTFDPTDFFVLGFSEQKTMKIGDPINGGVPGYIGKLVAQGPDVMVNAIDGERTGEVGSMPTFIFHPLDTSSLKVNEKITHRIVCSHQLNEAFGRILKQSTETGQVAICGAFWTGKTSIQGGKKSLNTYRFFERYLKDGEVLKPLSAG